MNLLTSEMLVALGRALGEDAAEARGSDREGLAAMLTNRAAPHSADARVIGGPRYTGRRAGVAQW